MTFIAIVAAMDRELHPLVNTWDRKSLSYGNEVLTYYENNQVIATAAGIGRRRAELAARAIVEKYRPELLISVGLAGALIRTLRIGNIVVPSVVVDSRTGEEYRCSADGDLPSGGVLVSCDEVAGLDAKARLVENFHGLVVDMEAAGVASVAGEFGIKFRCIKSISDEFDFPMPPLGGFIDQRGEIRAVRFAAWASVRPRYWLPTIRLARNTRRATQKLASWLQKNLAGPGLSAPVVKLDRAESFKP